MKNHFMVKCLYQIGPGAYEAPDLMGFKKICTSFSNAPSYTISHKKENNKQVISKGHCKVLFNDFI